MNCLIKYSSEKEFGELITLLEKAGYKNMFGYKAEDWKASTAKVVTAVTDAERWPIICTKDTSDVDKYFHAINITCAAAMAQAGEKFYTVDEFRNAVSDRY